MKLEKFFFDNSCSNNQLDQLELDGVVNSSYFFRGREREREK
jgi:hypothetical protein